MLVEAPPRGRCVRENNQRNDRRHVPAKRRSDGAREANLPIERRQQALEIKDPGLDLGDEQDPMRWMKSKQIHAATLPVSVERHLGLRDPTVSLESSLPDLAEKGMIGVEQACEVAPVTKDLQLHGGAQRQRDLPDSIQLMSTDPAGFELGDDGFGHAGALGKVELTPASPMTQHAQDAPDFLVAHPTILLDDPLPPGYATVGSGLLAGRCAVP
jgi:hypothetical protein